MKLSKEKARAKAQHRAKVLAEKRQAPKRRTKYYRQGKLEVSLGNLKLGEDTLIINMGTATGCPSRLLGFCKVGRDCYALLAENQYSKTVIPFRERQAEYWLSTDAGQIVHDLTTILTSRKRRVNGQSVPLNETVKYLRFNESGDFWSQACVEKLSHIANVLRTVFDIETYGYTARADLDFSNVHFTVKSSGYNNGNNGSTRVIHDRAEKVRGEVICPMDCTKCSICKVKNGKNVAFLLH